MKPISRGLEVATVPSAYKLNPKDVQEINKTYIVESFKRVVSNGQITAESEDALTFKNKIQTYLQE